MSAQSDIVPFNLVGFDHIVFLVDDLEKAVDFYQRVLGCQPGYSYPASGMEQLWCGNALIVLWDTTHPEAANAIPPVHGGRNVDHLCIAIGPVDHDALRDHLTRHGVALLEQAFHGGARGEGHAFFFLDPFGNKLELKGPGVYPDGRTATTSEIN